jgi:RHS repeat-associated protein
MALANSSGTPVEAYDTDAYGNTIIFTGPGADTTWFTDDDAQATYGANSIIYCGYRYDAETENYYVRNRYYSPSLGRWLTRDPIGYRGGINLYGYVNSSPVAEVDGFGADVILLTSPSEAYGFGHAAILVGSNSSGWTYYSKNAPGNGSPSGNTEQWYPSLNAFWNAQSKAENDKMNHAQRYPNEMLIPECKDRTAAMNKEAKAIVNQAYHVMGDNCADLAQEVLQAGGVPTGETGPLFWGYVGPSIPNNLWANLGNEWGNGQLPRGTTLITPAAPRSH